MHHSLLYGLCALVVAASVMLGGGTRPGFLSDYLLQLSAIPLVLIALWRLSDVPLTRPVRLAVMLCLAIAMVPLLQLVPLPPEFWTALPGRAIIADAYAVSGQPRPWLGISIAPQATWLSFLSLLPPVGVFLAMACLGQRGRRHITLVVLVVGGLSVFLGLLQVAQGRESPMRFFEFTSSEDAVGFFANRNHFASLLYCLALLTAAWLITKFNDLIAELQPGRLPAPMVMVSVVAGALMLLMIFVAIAMTRSRAGLGLMILSLGGAAALAAASQLGGSGAKRSVRGVTPLRLVLAVAVLAGIFTVQFMLYRLQSRFGLDILADARIPFARNTFEAAMAYAPFGSGMGSFVQVYGLVESSRDILMGTFANHSHNDLLQLLLENGATGLILMWMFSVWLIMRTVKIWRRPLSRGLMIDNLLARSAPLIIALIIAHSFVDYPLRTGAMLTVFAVACGLLLDTLPESAQADQTLDDMDRRRRRTTPPSATPAVPQPMFQQASAAPAAPIPLWPADATKDGAAEVQAPADAPEWSAASPATTGANDGGGFVWPKEWESTGDRSAANADRLPGPNRKRD